MVKDGLVRGAEERNGNRWVREETWRRGDCQELKFLTIGKNNKGV